MLPSQAGHTCAVHDLFWDISKLELDILELFKWYIQGSIAASPMTQATTSRVHSVMTLGFRQAGKGTNFSLYSGVLGWALCLMVAGCIVRVWVRPDSYMYNCKLIYLCCFTPESLSHYPSFQAQEPGKCTPFSGYEWDIGMNSVSYIMSCGCRRPCVGMG